jgi:hypothetical protein
MHVSVYYIAIWWQFGNITCGRVQGARGGSSAHEENPGRARRIQACWTIQFCKWKGLMRFLFKLLACIPQACGLAARSGCMPGSARSWVRIFVFLRVNGGVVHGCGFESLTFGGQWWCRSMVLGSNLILFGGQWWCSAWEWVCGFESLTFGGHWWCSARPRVRIFDFCVSMVASAWSRIRI